MRRTASLALALAVLALGSLPAAAGAFYDNGFEALPGAFLVSADYARLEQGDDTTAFAAISSDGRYVAIQTRARNFFADDDPDPPGQYRAGESSASTCKPGRWRRSPTAISSTKPTTPSSATAPPTPRSAPTAATSPSPPTSSCVPADVNDAIDVYRRDMDIPLPAGGACTGATPPPCPFQLVSARDGGEEPASYEQVGVPVPGSNPGAEVSRGVSISADGQKSSFAPRHRRTCHGAPSSTRPPASSSSATWRRSRRRW